MMGCNAKFLFKINFGHKKTLSNDRFSKILHVLLGQIEIKIIKRHIIHFTQILSDLSIRK